ncbi:MAG: glycine cleavage system protein GcvH [Candidatus Cloacimonadota bacterium]|nr:glycine cleavage system protein GcvH [Candidatus Cloacimonadota bacterium]
MIKEDLQYTETHEWVKVEGKIATIGITDYAQHELGDIVFVELPEIKDEIDQEDVLATIEAVKAVEEIYSPISGIVLEINDDLEDDSELINSSPYDEGWIVKMEITNMDELGNLLTADAYSKLIGE